MIFCQNLRPFQAALKPNQRICYPMNGHLALVLQSTESYMDVNPNLYAKYVILMFEKCLIAEIDEKLTNLDSHEHFH